jgi:hypothetical protein
VSKQENNRRACNNNLIHIAEDNYHSIFTNDEVREICEMLSKGIPIKDICTIMNNKILPRKYARGVENIIYQILNGVIWKSISKDYKFHDYSRIHLSDEAIHLVCQAMESDYGYDYIIDNVLGMSNCDTHKRERLKES